MNNFAEHILASSPAILYACKAGGDYGGTYISSNIKELLGYRPEEFLEDSAFWKDHVHPDDLEQVLAGLETVFTAGRYACEYRFRAKSGEYRWIRDELRLVRNEATGVAELVGSWLDITERKALEEKYRRFSGLTSDYVHYCRRTGSAPFRVEWVAGAVNPICGFSIDDIRDRGCWLPLVHPDDRQAVTAYLFSLVPGDCKTIEFRIVSKQQQVRWVAEQSRCEAGQAAGELVLYGAVTDITERKHAEEALRDSESFLREAARLARLGRWRWDILADEAEWSTVTREIFGLAALERKINYADFIGAVHPDDRTAVEAALREALNSRKEYAIDHRILLPDGELRYVHEQAQVHYDLAGKPVRMVGTVLDVTAQKLVEERLRESDRIKSEFIATASHELRTPLAVIQGYAELLLDGHIADADQHRDFLAIIHDKALALEKIVDDLLDVSRIESGRMVCLDLAPVNIVEEIRKGVDQFEKEAPRHRFSLTLPADAVELCVDRMKIVQVLDNLLNNAVKFSPADSAIIVKAQLCENCFQVMVADEGPGLTPENQPHVFEKFFRAEATDTSVPGLGLGLYLVRKIIEAHRGKVWLESVPGQGAQFYFSLPLPDQNPPPR